MHEQALMKQAHRPVWQLLRSQSIVLLLAVIITGILGKGMAAMALLGGGLSWLLSSSVHALIFMRVIWPSQVKQTMARFFVAELARWALGGGMAAATILLWPAYALWVFAGLGLTALAVLWSPVLTKIGL